jgi:ribonuclease BN (tRNA processing enzyme)
VQRQLAITGAVTSPYRREICDGSDIPDVNCRGTILALDPVNNDRTGSMNLRILGCSGGIGTNMCTTSLMVDSDILIDGGTGLSELSLEEMSGLRHIFVTHSHLDHIAGIPMLLDSVFDELDQPLVLHARAETIQVLREHIFNWQVWPDFSCLPSEDKPILRFEVMQPGERIKVGNRSVEMIAVNHAVPAAGYRVQNGVGSFAFSGDTTSNDVFWEALNQHDGLDMLIVESAFPDEERDLSSKARHYCPQLLATDLKKLKHRPRLFLTHLKPGSEDLILDQCRSQIDSLPVQRLCGGDRFKL